MGSKSSRRAPESKAGWPGAAGDRQDGPLHGGSLPEPSMAQDRPHAHSEPEASWPALVAIKFRDPGIKTGPRDCASPNGAVRSAPVDVRGGGAGSPRPGSPGSD